MVNGRVRKIRKLIDITQFPDVSIAEQLKRLGKRKRKR